jgi:hypothetical protein
MQSPTDAKTAFLAIECKFRKKTAKTPSLFINKCTAYSMSIRDIDREWQKRRKISG